MKTSILVSTSIVAFFALLQVCPAPPAVLGPIIIAADGAVGGSAIAAGINHDKLKRADEKHRSLKSGMRNEEVGLLLGPDGG